MCIFCDLTTAEAAYNSIQEAAITWVLVELTRHDSDANIQQYATEWMATAPGERTRAAGLTPERIVKRLRKMAKEPAPVQVGRNKGEDSKSRPYVFLCVNLFGPSDEQVVCATSVTKTAYDSIKAVMAQQGMRFANASEPDYDAAGDAQTAKATEDAMAKAFQSATNGTRH